MIYCVEGLLEIYEYTKDIIFTIEIIEYLFGKINLCVSCAKSSKKTRIVKLKAI